MWTAHHANIVSDNNLMKIAISRWKDWQHRWGTATAALYRLTAHRITASAMHHWHLEASTRSRMLANRKRRRQEALKSLLMVCPLRKCFLALRENAALKATLRSLLESLRARSLRDGLNAWRLHCHQQRQHEQQMLQCSDPGVFTTKRRHVGKPRKIHCRCVYAVSRGQRCVCSPQSHLLRRVEELHRLVGQGLDGREGGFRLLTHTVQHHAPRERGSCSNARHVSMAAGGKHVDNAVIRKKTRVKRCVVTGAAETCHDARFGGPPAAVEHVTRLTGEPAATTTEGQIGVLDDIAERR